MITAKGQLRHHFWGKYYATIVVAFESEKDTSNAKNILNEDIIKYSKDIENISLWTIHKQNSKALVWHGNDEALKICEKVLVYFGADENKISSVSKSIDFGEPFSIQFRNE